MNIRSPFRTFLVSLMCISSALAGYPTLSGPNYPPSKQGECLMISVMKNGSLVTDAGNIRTVEGIIDICKDWRKQRTEPGIRILLYPALASNNDLGAILPLIEALHREKIKFDIIIAEKSEQPPADLLQNPEQ